MVCVLMPVKTSGKMHEKKGMGEENLQHGRSRRPLVQEYLIKKIHDTVIIEEGIWKVILHHGHNIVQLGCICVLHTGC